MYWGGSLDDADEDSDFSECFDATDNLCVQWETNLDADDADRYLFFLFFCSPATLRCSMLVHSHLEALTMAPLLHRSTASTQQLCTCQVTTAPCHDRTEPGNLTLYANDVCDFNVSAARTEPRALG